MLGLADDAKAEPLVERPRAVIGLQHLQAERFAERVRFGQLARDELGTDPAALVLGQQLDADQEDVVRRLGGRNGPNRYAVEPGHTLPRRGRLSEVRMPWSLADLEERLLIGSTLVEGSTLTEEEARQVL